MRGRFEHYYEKYEVYNRALMPLQRKILLLAYALYKNDTLYDPNYKNSPTKTEQAALTDCLQ